MTIGVAVLTSGADEVAGSSKVTASVTPTPGRLYIAACNTGDSAGGTDLKTVSGCGITWSSTHNNGSTFDGALGQGHQCSVFSGRANVPTTGSLTFSIVGGVTHEAFQWIFLELTNARGVVNVAFNNAIPGDSVTATLSTAFKDPLNIALGFFNYGIVPGVVTPGSGFTEDRDINDGLFFGMQTEHKENDTTVDATAPAGQNWCQMTALEIEHIRSIGPTRQLPSGIYVPDRRIDVATRI